MSVFHGGDVARLEGELGVSLEGCLDLSTGLSPWAYPVPPVPDHVWRLLPYDASALIAAASAYYACPVDLVTPVSGVQDAISRLPHYMSPQIVALPVLGYQEHHRSWRKAGHRVVLYQDLAELHTLIDTHSNLHVVMINPNNPSTQRYPIESVIDLSERLVNKGALIVDEAFMDVSEEQSVSSLIDQHNLIIFRSFGKFFGLAGVRLGFVLGAGQLVERLRDDIQPWGVSYPAIWLGEQALNDVQWCQVQRQRIRQQADDLLPLINHKMPGLTQSAGLFITTIGEANRLHPLYKKAAESGILLRYDTFGSGKAWLRAGLPGDQADRFTSFLDTL